MYRAYLLDIFRSFTPSGLEQWLREVETEKDRVQAVEKQEDLARVRDLVVDVVHYHL